MFIEFLALSVILTWLYNSTDSLFFGLVFYSIYITLGQTISPAVQVGVSIHSFQQINSIILVNIALLVVLFCGGKRLVFEKAKRTSPA